MTIALKTGDLVAGRFKITEELGRGAMGVVYKAHDATLDREVALKTIRFDVIADETDASSFRERFQREARTAARLAHPNIVTIFDVGEWEGTSYMAIEYLRGVSLHEVLKPKQPLPLDYCLKITIQICRGLDEAHNHGIVHRDIKPANIMLVKNDQVKITDFGIAKVQSSATLTKEGAIVGTPSYMSPEQLSDKSVDGRSDIFACGAVLYEMLTGERAFSGENITTVILKVVTQHPESPRRKNPNLPAEVERIVERALHKDQTHRYQTMADLAADLEHLQMGSPVGTMTRPAPRPAPTPAPPVSSGPSLQMPTDTDDYEVPAQGPSKGLLYGAIGAVVLLTLVAVIVVPKALQSRRGDPTPTPTPTATATPTPTAPTPTPTPAPTLPAGPSVAAIPFEGKGASSLEWLGPGLAQLFEADLAQSEKIHVVSQEEVAEKAAKLGIDMKARLSSDSIQKLGQELAVRTILTGSYDVTGKVIRFDVYLYEAGSGKILVTDYDKADGEKEIWKGVDNLTIRLRDALGALPDAAGGDPDRDVAQVLTSDLEALKHFVAGRNAFISGDKKAATESFKKATAKDPSFAAAHGKLSQTYAAMGRGELEEEARKEAEAKAKAKADEDAKQAEMLKLQESQRLEEMRKRVEERKTEEEKLKKDAEAEARRKAEQERRAGGTSPTPAPTTAPTAAAGTPTPGATEATEATPAAAVKEGDLVPAQDVTVAPAPLTRAELEITPAMKKRGIQHGLIILSVLVNPLGKVEDAKVLRSDVAVYNDAAIQSVKKWTFSPPEKDGVKVRTWFTVSMKI